MKIDLKAYLQEQKEWSEKTFGPGERTEGVIAHIRSELEEVLTCPTDVYEWVDIIILAFDGALRVGHSPYDICQALLTKLDINKNREWPDYRAFTKGEAIEHIREFAMPVVKPVFGIEPDPAFVERLIRHTQQLFSAATAKGAIG